MDVNNVLTHLVRKESFPAMKLAWNCQMDLRELPELPKISPSHYVSEITLNTDQRHSLLCQQQKKLEFWGPGLEFSVVPSIVVFQQYKGGDSQTVNLKIRNISRQTQKVHVRMEDTGIFSLEYKSACIAKFASGMTISATIKFTPADSVDYFHRIVISSKTSSFAIPILAIGGRAVLDIPDKINFGKVAVKHLKQLTHTICNTGSASAKFTLSADGPFGVCPEKGVLAPNDSFSMIVACYSETIGPMEGYLCLKFDNGEEIYTTLTAETVNEDIYITPAEVNFTDTYMGLKTSERFSITNNSKTVLKFSWKRYAVRYQRQTSIGSTASIFNMIRQSIADSSALHPSEHRNSIIPGELHVEPVLRPELLFHDKNFAIEPMTGEVQPLGSVDIHMIFTPTDVRNYGCTPYLDITGQEERIPVHLCGEGLGPKFKFGFDSLDTGEVSLGTGHTYEIPITNISEIKGTIVFEGRASLMPMVNFHVEPHKIKLAPGQFSAFYVSFNYTGTPGHFLEEFNFRVHATEEVHTVLLRGVFTWPDAPELNYSTPEQDGDVYREFIQCEPPGLWEHEEEYEEMLICEQIIAALDERELDFQITEPLEEIRLSFDMNLRGFLKGKFKGEAHGPAIVCDRKAVDFGVIPNGAEAVETITLTNTSNFCVTYKWYILPNSTYIKQRPVTRSASLYPTQSPTPTAAGAIDVQKRGPNKQGRTLPAAPPVAKDVVPQLEAIVGPHCSQLFLHHGVHVHADKDAKEYPIRVSSAEDEIRDILESTSPEEFGTSVSMTHLNLFGDSVQFVRDKIHRGKFMEIVGLQDPSRDIIDELHYLQMFSPYKEPIRVANMDKSATVPGSRLPHIAEIVDITPLLGVIQAGRQQTFTIVFYGHTEIQFETLLTCYLDEGRSYAYTPVTVTGKSTKPTHEMLYPGQKSFIPTPSPGTSKGKQKPKTRPRPRPVPKSPRNIATANKPRSKIPTKKVTAAVPVKQKR